MHISIKNLKKSYGGIPVLKDLNLEILEGETLIILGRSGVGKSVLLRQIIGLEEPDDGIVELDGHNINTLSSKEREPFTREMGMLFQGGALFDSMNVLENTGFYLKQHFNYTPQERQDIVLEALRMVGIQDAADKMPSELSGGMRKRAALARVIAYKPRVILYDEPTTGLDPITAHHINELIRQTQQKLKATSVVVTHDIRSAFVVGDRLAFHHDGQIIHIAPRDTFFQIDDPLLKSFFEHANVKIG